MGVCGACSWQVPAVLSKSRKHLAERMAYRLILDIPLDQP